MGVKETRGSWGVAGRGLINQLAVGVGELAGLFFPYFW